MLKVFLIYLFSLFEFGESGYVHQRPGAQIFGVNSCRLNYNGQVGACQRFSQCPSAQFNYYTQRTTPIYCQYNQVDPIVCCASVPYRTSSQQVAQIVPQRIQSGPYFYSRPGQDRSKPSSQVQNCRLNSSGKIGICQKFSKCPEAQSALTQNRLNPIYCQYDRVDPVICCDTIPVIKTSDPADRIGRISKESISEKKCREFYFPNLSVSFAVGGVPAEPDEFPFMAAIGYRRNFDPGYDYKCGGTVIAPTYILSAAHCGSVGGAPPDIAKIGGNSLSGKRGIYPEIPIIRVYVHPRYSRRQIYNDIAIFQLSKPASTDYACLWPQHTITSHEATAIGYGATAFGGPNSQILLKVRLNVYSNEVCKQFYPVGSFKTQSGITNTELCAGDPLKIMDTCQGDSGGPILIKVPIRSKEIPYILGITSFGQGCAGGPPSVYTRISAYLNWIEQIVWPSG